jgi:hypothetical protein
LSAFEGERRIRERPRARQDSGMHRLFVCLGYDAATAAKTHLLPGHFEFALLEGLLVTLFEIAHVLTGLCCLLVYVCVYCLSRYKQ